MDFPLVKFAPAYGRLNSPSESALSAPSAGNVSVPGSTSISLETSSNSISNFSPAPPASPFEEPAGESEAPALSPEEQAARQARLEAERLKAIVPGCYVRIKGQTAVGEVMEIGGKSAVVAFGSLKTTVRLDRLEVTQARPQTSSGNVKATFVSSQTQDSMYEKKLAFKQDIDVRGMRGDEALQAVTYFIDDAILVGVSRVRILHGTGTGILRTLIRQYLQTVPGVRHFQDEHVQFGGAGITVVDLS